MSLQITFTKSMLEGLSKSTLIEIICSLQKADAKPTQTHSVATRTTRRVATRAQWTPAQDEALLNDLARGYTVAAHAKRCQRSHKSVYMRLRRLQEAGKTELGARL
jgi:hypothetical protein